MQNTNNTTTAKAKDHKPDFYARLLADTPADKAAGILAALCRRKDYAIRRIMADHEQGISFDEAIKALAKVYQQREVRP